MPINARLPHEHNSRAPPSLNVVPASMQDYLASIARSLRRHRRRLCINARLPHEHRSPAPPSSTSSIQSHDDVDIKMSKDASNTEQTTTTFYFPALIHEPMRENKKVVFAWCRFVFATQASRCSMRHVCSILFGIV